MIRPDRESDPVPGLASDDHSPRRTPARAIAVWVQAYLLDDAARVVRYSAAARGCPVARIRATPARDVAVADDDAGLAFTTIV